MERKWKLITCAVKTYKKSPPQVALSSKTTFGIDIVNNNNPSGSITYVVFLDLYFYTDM